jgi:sorbitol-specific phosphotransferase system component IIBC
MEQNTKPVISKIHEIYGGHVLLALIAAVILTVVIAGPKPVIQRITAVLVDINIVIGLIALFVSHKAISALHPIAALAAVALLHIAAKSDKKSKVLICYTLALLLLVVAWAINAPWGPAFLKGNLLLPAL